MLKTYSWWVPLGFVCLLLGACSERKQYEGHLATMIDVHGTEYLTHEVIVRQNAGVTHAEFTAALAEIGATLSDDDSALARRLHYVRIILPNTVTADEAISFLQEKEITETAERNYIVSVDTSTNDPRLNEMWGLSTIQAFDAWEYTTGSEEIVVAVTDTGIDHQHPDLAENMWINSDEIPNNGVDDDGNGYIDDINGWDWVSDDADPADDQGHGTHCAGTIGAVGNNSIGIVGVNWNVRLQALKFMYPTADGRASGSLWDAAQSIIYAAENGARVINASWGCTGCNAWYVRDAITTYQDAGGIFVAAAGNDGLNNDTYPHYPSSHDHSNIIAVAATSSDDTLASFSNYGVNSVDIGAPGVRILSTIPGAGYASWNGTSMAAPHVAGLAALYLSLKPDATNEDLISKIYASGDELSALSGKTTQGNRINAYNLIHDNLLPPPSPTSLAAVAGPRDDIALNWDPAPSVAADQSPIASFRLHWGTTSGTYTDTQDIPVSETSRTLTGLVSTTRYYFALTTVNGKGTESAPSNEATAVAQDSTPPAEVIDLEAGAVPGDIAPGWVSQSSGEFSDYWAASHVYDGDPNTGWSTPPRAQAQEEYITIGLAAPTLINEVTFIPTPAYPEFFPIDLDVEISLDGNQWQPVGGLREMTNNLYNAQTVRFTSTSASHVRARILRTYQHPSGNFYCGLGEIQIREVSESPTTINLNFTAPGDDPGSGHATSYDLRHLTSPITEANFHLGTTIPTEAPKAAGVLESISVSDLQPETHYYFALIAEDDSGNVSSLSNIADASTLVVPPNPVVDLAVDSVEATSVTLRWTASGDNGNTGQATSYDLRVSQNPITAANFFSASKLPMTIAPSMSGSEETYTIPNLVNGALYYFALKVTDTAGATSGISNVITAQPQSGEDLIPPGTINDLNVFQSWTATKAPTAILEASTGISGFGSASALVDGSFATDWYIPSDSEAASHFAILDLGRAKRISRLRIHPSTQIGQTDSIPAHIAIDLSANQATWHPALEIDDLDPDASPMEYAIETTEARYVRLRILKHNSAQPNSPTDGCCWYSYISELDILTLPDHFNVDLTWVAPGDDEWLGTASSYDLRHSTSPMDVENFSGATSIESPTPSAAGMIELQRVSDLAMETTHYFGITATDDSGNTGEISNITQITTPTIPPAAIVDLKAKDPTQTSMVLDFTATGDDGNEGTATSYVIKFSTDPLNSINWEDATVASHSTIPKAPGSQEEITITGLTHSTVYYFGIMVIDDIATQSLLSNIAVGETLDGTSPAAISDLSATIHNPALEPPMSGSVTVDSGSYDDGTTASNLADGDPTTIWLSQGRPSLTDEYVILDLEESQRLGRIRIASALSYLDLFPKSFEIYLRNSAQEPWQLIIKETQFSTTNSWEEWSIGSVVANSIKIRITETTSWAGYYFASIAEIEIYKDPTDFTRMELGWTAPGDDGLEGTAIRYDIRTSSSNLTEETFDGNAILNDPPTPQEADSLERYEAQGLNPETTYCFAIKTEDDSNNISAISNSPCATTPGIPPATISNLSVEAVTGTTAGLRWTAPGDDGHVGTAAQYEIRYSTERINNLNWGNALVANAAPTPTEAGTNQSASIEGLSGLTTYYFVIRARDDGGNWSALSNNAISTTADNIPPATTTDLAAQTNPDNTGSIFLTWTAPGDNGITGLAESYEIRASLTPITTTNFSQGLLVVSPAPSNAGSAESLTVTGLAPEIPYFFALITTDSKDNDSTLSNNATAWTRDEAPSQINNLQIVQISAQPPTLTLEWSSPGDNGPAGTATSYDIRVGFEPITEENFEAQPELTNPPIPAISGTSQQATVPDLLSGTQYYFAIRAEDDRGNLGPISNVIDTLTADIAPPNTIDDLVASAGSTTGSLLLSWTSPGDDGSVGKATAYDIRYSFNEITPANFELAADLPGEPVPFSAGVPHFFNSEGFPSEELVYVAMRTRDEAHNWSGVSNTASSRTPDIAPGKVFSLTFANASLTSVGVTFTATGDDGYLGTATEYDLRISTEELTEQNFEAAQRILTTAPQESGTQETLIIENLSVNTTYYVAFKAIDERGNTSPMSNRVVVATTDNDDPGRVTDLTATTGTAAGSIILNWTATGDNGDQGQASSYELRYSSTPITYGAWSLATVIEQSLTPLVAGEAQSFLVAGFPGETRLYFGILAVDDEGNRGMVSNSAPGDTPPIPPARIQSLSASADGTTINLTWISTGDDGLNGTASSYEMRYSTELLTAENFADATLIDSLPAPIQSGGNQSTSVPGLAESTTYYFAMIVTDDVGATSALSNIATTSTADLTAPGGPSGLIAIAPSLTNTAVPVSEILASSTLGPNWEPANAVDDSSTTAWSSTGTTEQTTETLILTLDATVSVDRIRLAPDDLYAHLFPIDFNIEVNAGGSSWTTVVVEEELSASDGTSITWGFPAQNVSKVRINATETNTSYGLHYVVIANIEVVKAQLSSGEAQLTWMAPGDDGATGIVDHYEIYQHSTSFDETSLGEATLVSQGPTPQSAGSLQTWSKDQLEGETTYFWAVRAIDEADNIGPLSTTAEGQTNAVAPSTVTDLSANSQGMHSIELSFTSPGDDLAVGTATRYDIRYANFPLTSQTFALATTVSSPPTPQAAGSYETLTVSNLDAGTMYRFALISYDEEDTPSYISNIAISTTAEAPDFTAPAEIASLVAQFPDAGGDVQPGVAQFWTGENTSFEASNITDNDYNSMWSVWDTDEFSPASIRVRLTETQPIDTVKLWAGAGFAHLFPVDFSVHISPDGLQWTETASFTDISMVAETPLTIEFASSTITYIEVRATRRAASTDAEYYYVAIAELEALSAKPQPGSALLSWTAPGDDDNEGQATSYDMRVGVCPYSHFAATPITTFSPAEAGSPERYIHTGLASGTHCFGLTTADESGNISGLSPIAEITIE